METEETDLFEGTLKVISLRSSFQANKLLFNNPLDKNLPGIPRIARKNRLGTA
jgi:hypothetical protein